MDSALLAQIQKGKALKKTETNDRSAPIIGTSKPSGGAMGGGMARPPMPGMGPPPTMSHTASAPPITNNNAPTAPQLGGLFANGMPTLRKTRGAAVDTGRGTSSPSTPPPPPPPTNAPSTPPPPPGRLPTFNKPPIHNTLPKNFKVPPPVPGKTPSFNSPTVPPMGGGPPPPPPPPPGPGGIPPKVQASLVPPVPGRARSNSSPQRPIPPPPPRNGPSPTITPAKPPIMSNNNNNNSTRSIGVPPKVGLPNRPNIPVPTPPSAPPTFNRGNVPKPPVFNNNTRPPVFNNNAGNASPPPPPPPPPPTTTTMNNNNNSPVATPPRSPLPPPPPVPQGNKFGAPSMFGGAPKFSNNAPTREVPLTEGGGRYTFRPISSLPPPRNNFVKKQHVYPSGENRGNSYPLDYSRFR